MSEADWDAYKANLGDAEKGVEGTHSILSNPLSLEVGSLYYRDFNVNTGIVKNVLNNPTFVAIDGTRAVSMRARIRLESTNQSSDTNKHFVFLAKTNAANPTTTTSNWASTWGYKIGAWKPFGSTLLNTAWASGNSTSFSNLTTGELAISQWHFIRADIVPVYTGSTITSDQIKLYKSTDNGTTWTQIGSTQTVSISGGSWNTWGSATYKYYGFQNWGFYVDNFEIYLSELVS